MAHVGRRAGHPTWLPLPACLPAGRLRAAAAHLPGNSVWHAAAAHSLQPLNVCTRVQSSKPVDEKLVERRKEGVHPGKVGGCWIVAARPVDRFSWWRGDREGVHLGKVRGWAWLL